MTELVRVVVVLPFTLHLYRIFLFISIDFSCEFDLDGWVHVVKDRVFVTCVRRCVLSVSETPFMPCAQAETLRRARNPTLPGMWQIKFSTSKINKIIDFYVVKLTLLLMYLRAREASVTIKLNAFHCVFKNDETGNQSSITRWIMFTD